VESVKNADSVRFGPSVWRAFVLNTPQRCPCTVLFGWQVLDHVMVGIEGVAKERGHHLIRER